jgi:hypothetical protein
MKKNQMKGKKIRMENQKKRRKRLYALTAKKRATESMSALCQRRKNLSSQRIRNYHL